MISHFRHPNYSFFNFSSTMCIYGKIKTTFLTLRKLPLFFHQLHIIIFWNIGLIHTNSGHLFVNSIEKNEIKSCNIYDTMSREYYFARFHGRG
jgi:hypothetical protein